MAELLTWVLVPGGVDVKKDPAFALIDKKVAGELLYKRPRLGLRRRGEGFRFLCASKADRDELKNRYGTDERMRLFSLHDYGVLAELARDPLRFHVEGRMWRLHAGTEGDAPYGRRMLELGREKVGAVGLTEIDTVERIDDVERLFLEPIPVPTESDDSISNWRQRFAESQCAILPPVRGEWGDDSYYAEDRRRFRRSMREALRSVEHDPLMLELCRVLDDPLVRDLHAEGMVLRPFLRPAGDSYHRTLTIAGYWPAEPSAVHAYRRAFLAGELQRSGGWRIELSDCLRADLTAAAGVEELFSGSDEETVSGRVAAVTPKDPERTRGEHGFWSLFVEIVKSLPEETAKPLKRHVVYPTRPRSTEVEHLKTHPNHDQAERLFIANFCRCPWSLSTDVGPWRRRVQKGIQRWAEQTKLEAGEGLSDREDWPRLDRRMTPWKFMHLPAPERHEELGWTLDLPVGTVFRSGGDLVLDSPDACLDGQFVLG